MSTIAANKRRSKRNINRTSKTVFEAILCSGIEPARMKLEDEEVREKFSYFPLILMKGSARLKNYFTLWLEV